MRLEQLKYLVEIANCHSINKAAQSLYITQPALSIAINALEEELQYPLLKRTKKGVVLTEDGQRVLVEAQMILETIKGWQLDRAEQEIHMEGVVHVLAIPSVCTALSNTLVCRMQQSQPKLSIFLHEKQQQQEIISTLENSAINIGIVSEYQVKIDKLLRRAEERGWQAERLIEDERCILISTKNPLAQKEVLTKAELSQMILAYYSDQTDSVASNYKEYFSKERSFRLSNRESIMQLIVEDKAVGIFPDKITRNMFFRKNSFIKAIPIAGVDMKIFYVLLHPDIKQMSINEIRMMQIIREEFVAYQKIAELKEENEQAK